LKSICGRLEASPQLSERYIRTDPLPPRHSTQKLLETLPLGRRMTQFSRNSKSVFLRNINGASLATFFGRFRWSSRMWGTRSELCSSRQVVYIKRERFPPTILQRKSSNLCHSSVSWVSIHVIESLCFFENCRVSFCDVFRVLSLKLVSAVGDGPMVDTRNLNALCFTAMSLCHLRSGTRASNQ